ncbi:MAG: rhamnulokinase [Bacteroidales bacterium]|nr:rhamnulokinase [Bacteroidales bacterium]
MAFNSISVDLGATSGRVVLAKLDNGKLELEEVHRFPNGFSTIAGRTYCNLYYLFDEIRKGLKKVGSRGIEVASIGVDTWGVDVVCVGSDGHILSQPRAYRDPYTDGMMEEYFKIVPKDEVYRRTGIQFMNFNTLFQLFTLHREGNSSLEAADRVLFLPDALSFLMTGNMVCEYTILSTSQFLNPYDKKIDEGLLEAAGIDPDLFPGIVMPGHVVGPLTDELARETGLGPVRVIAVAGHDTGSAVAAVPATTKNFAYLSSGTWSLIGIEAYEPIIGEESFKENYTNEGGIDGTIRFLKNVTGMWLLEQCRVRWAEQGKDYSYPQIVEMMGQAKPFVSFVDPDDPVFAAPDDMEKAIKDYCRSHGEAVPEDDKALVRCIFESLALKYRNVIDTLNSKFVKEPIEVLHIIGGGSKNALLNQITANATKLRVLAGPSEATTIGNVMIQARAAGIVNTKEEMRALIGRSITLEEYLPQDTELWDAAYKRFKEIISK